MHKQQRGSVEALSRTEITTHELIFEPNSLVESINSIRWSPITRFGSKLCEGRAESSETHNRHETGADQVLLRLFLKEALVGSIFGQASSIIYCGAGIFCAGSCIRMFASGLFRYISAY